MLRVVVAAPPRIRRPEDLATLPAAADLVELRLDLLPDVEDAASLARWIALSPRPVLATLRSEAQGGAFRGDPGEAARRLGDAAVAGAAWLDVEGPVAPHLEAVPPDVRVVVSHHGRVDAALPAEVGGRAVALWKVAPAVDGARALAAAEARARQHVPPPPLVLVPTGPLAALRAALAGPGALLYGAADREARVASNQPTLLDLLDDLRPGEVGRDAARLGLLGTPIEDSWSPRIHNAALRWAGADAHYLPVPDLAPAEALSLGAFVGFSVTAPYKALALEAADEAEEDARATGAANTLWRDGTIWRAANTDVLAVERAAGRAPARGAAYVHGAGGFARAAVRALVRGGWRVRVGARRPEAARAIARALDVEPAPGAFARRPEDALVVNATPAGRDGDVPEAFARADLGGLHVLDAPYARGASTGLAAAARAAGARVTDGLALLLAQAVGQIARFLPEAPDADVATLRLAVEARGVLVLLGLRGAGKSEVGARVARRLGRPFVDLDDEVLRITGVEAARWIRERGLEAFRAVEAEALARQGGREGLLVVAAGGGVVETATCRRWLAANATCAWLVVPPEVAAHRVLASADDRPPLLPGADPHEEARRLLARRRGAYAELAAFEVDAADTVERVADAVVAGWRAHAEAGSADRLS